MREFIERDKNNLKGALLCSNDPSTFFSPCQQHVLAGMYESCLRKY